MRVMRFLVLLTALVVFCTSSALAFDGDRKGFMLNLGLGFGQAKQIVSSGGLSASVDATGVGGDFKIGGGVNQQTLLYYTNRTLFHSMDLTVYDPDSEVEYGYSPDLINGMSAFGVSYFLEPQAPSLFFSGALGIGVLTDSDAEESETGVGYTVGLGYEFASNWIIEATYMRAKVAEEFGMDLSISNLMVSVSWLAY